MTLYPHNPSHDPPIKSKTIRSVKPTAPTILSYAHLLSIPLPSSKTIFDPPTLEESLDAKIILRPKVEELIPLILVIQQYVVACLFRSQLDAVGMKDRVEVVLSALKKEGNSLDWKLLAEEHPREFEGSVEKEAISKKVDTIMTSMFGAITKGLIGADSFSGELILLL